MTLSTTIFGTENRLRPAVKAFLTVTFLRVAWFYINRHNFDDTVLTAVFPWPFRYYSWTVWAVELALTITQVVAGIRLARLLMLNYAPDAARYLGFSIPTTSELQMPVPRSRSWLPTAALLSGIVILTCCGGTWAVLMLNDKEWFPFDYFMSDPLSEGPLYLGLGLSALGFMFGGRYIARAAGDVSTTFQVLTVGDDHWLAKRVHGLAERLGLPKPIVGVTNVINAFAMGANQKTAMVVIGKPLFDLKEDELDAIIGHELGHVLHNDVARMQFAEGFQQMLAKVIHLVTIFGAIMAASAGKRGRSSQANVQLVLGTGQLVRGTVFVASELVAKGISRNREFHADAVGAQLTSPDAMARALKWVHGVADRPTPEERHYGYLMFRGSRFGNLFATHPPLAARLRALNADMPAPPAAEAVVEQDALSALSSSSAAALSPRTSGTSPTLSDAVRGAFKAPVIVQATDLVKNLPLKKIGIVLLAIIGFLALAPAVISYYQLDDRARNGGTALASFATSSWDWASDRTLALKQAVVGADGTSPDQLQIAALETENKQLKAVADDNKLDAEVAKLKASQAASRIADLQAELARLKADAQSGSGDTSGSGAVDTIMVNTLRGSVDYLRRELASLHDQIRDRDQKITTLEAENLPQRVANLQTEIILKSTALDAERAKTAELEEQVETLQLEIEGLQASAGTAESGKVVPTVQPQSTVNRMQVFGAIATDNTGLIILTEIDFASSNDAQKGALLSCQQFGGIFCQVKATFNNVCAAVARVSPGGKRTDYRAATGSTTAEAEQKALNTCTRANGRECMITRSVCPQ